MKFTIDGDVIKFECSCEFDERVNAFERMCGKHETGIENQIEQYQADIEHDLFMRLKYRDCDY